MFFRRSGFALFLALSSLPLSGFSAEPYAILDALVSKKQLPRILNSDDIALNPNDPEPIFTPSGDFDGDGVEDVAISGIYNLPAGKERYFLLVGTQFQNPVRTAQLFFKEYEQPVFLHKPGTTGEKDPGNQAFSITFCSHCTDGEDATWDSKKKKFAFVPWEQRVRRYQQLPHAPAIDLIAPETTDQALKIAGELKDVRAFVAELKQKNRSLGSRVERRKPSDPPTVVNVLIFEKLKNREDIYDVITVDTEKGEIIDRRKKKMKFGKGKAPGAPR